MELSLNTENFESEVLMSEKPVLVDFWATWCGPCKRQGPIVAELAEQGYKVGKVDVDDQPELASQYKVMSIPTLIIFRQGQEAERLVGLTPKEKLAELLEGSSGSFISGKELADRLGITRAAIWKNIQQLEKER